MCSVLGEAITTARYHHSSMCHFHAFPNHTTHKNTTQASHTTHNKPPHKHPTNTLDKNRPHKSTPTPTKQPPQTHPTPPLHTQVIPGYGGGMSSAKAALESDTRVLAYEAGRKYRIRVNSISAGPLGSRAAKAIGFIDDMIRYVGVVWVWVVGGWVGGCACVHVWVHVCVYKCVHVFKCVCACVSPPTIIPIPLLPPHTTQLLLQQCTHPKGAGSTGSRSGGSILAFPHGLCCDWPSGVCGQWIEHHGVGNRQQHTGGGTERTCSCDYGQRINVAVT